MKRRTILAGTAAIAIAIAIAIAVTPTASAQTEPMDGNSGVVGVVPSMLELTINGPASGTFSTFAKPRTYSTSIRIQATTSEPRTFLTLADGEVASGARLGHLSAGAKRIPAPLEASVKGAFTSLDTPLVPQLAAWTTAVAHATATIKLRQRVTATASGPYRKVLLATLSTDTP